MSGSEAYVGQWYDHGVQAGIWEVNAHGGVLGNRLVSSLQDTGGDPVDAVTAYRTLLLHSPNFILGPSSLEIMGVINLLQKQRVVDLMEGGTTQLDRMHYSYVFRTFPSDSAQLAAEAFYALRDLRCHRASLVYTSNANTQAEVGPITTAFESNGGTIVDVEDLQPAESSYLSEVSRTFANHPGCIFFDADPQTTATYMDNVRQLGHMNVHFIAGDTGASLQMAQAMGLSDASRWLTGLNTPPSFGRSYDEFVRAYRHVWHTNSILPAAPAMYDAVILASLAMVDAHSTNPHIWVHYVTKVSNPPGVAVYTYAQGVALLHKGVKINYQGASGPENFNRYHNVFSGFEVVQFNAAGTGLRPIANVTASDVASMYTHR